MSGRGFERKEAAALKELGSNNLVAIVTERCTIGRDPSNNIVVSGDPCVSRFHSVISFEDGAYYIGDSGSWNGTIVNGEKVFVRHPVVHGDKIRVGLTRFEFVLGIEPQSLTESSEGAASAPESVHSQTVIVGGKKTDPQETTHSLPEGAKKPDASGGCRGQDSINESSDGARMPVLPDITLTSLDVETTAAVHDEMPVDKLDWCNGYFEAELNQLESDLLELKDLASEIMHRIRKVGEKIVLTQDVRNALLLEEGDKHIFGCARIFEQMGWAVKVSDTDSFEVRLTRDGLAPVIAHIASPLPREDRDALSRLVVSQIDYWSRNHVEPKGILVLTAPGQDPQSHQRLIGDDDLLAYAEKKNICLMTSVQLLAIYREIALHQAEAESFRHGLMITSGRLSNLDLEPSRPRVEV